VPVEQWTKLDRAILAWRRKRRPYATAVFITAEIGVGVDLVPNDRRLSRVSG
jgi:hypothetical protein